MTMPESSVNNEKNDSHRIENTARRETGAPMNETWHPLPSAAHADWGDWRWQQRNMLRSAADLEAILELTDEEQATITALDQGDAGRKGSDPDTATF